MSEHDQLSAVARVEFGEQAAHVASASASRRSSATPTTFGPSTRWSTRSRCRARSTTASASFAAETDWGTGNLFTVHNWWHLGLYLLEAGRHDEVLAIYDAQVHHEGSDGVPFEMLDGTALLWRLMLDGIDTGGRFGPLADAWTSRVGGDSWYAFNDLHAVIALCGAGRLDDARQVVDDLTRYVVSTPAHLHSNAMMAAGVGLPASRAVIAFTEGRHGDVVDELWPIRAGFQRVGGSHAQRDLLQRTLTDSAIRSGHLDLARALLAERLSQRDTSV